MQQCNYQLNKANPTVCENGRIFASHMAGDISFSCNYLKCKI